MNKTIEKHMQMLGLKVKDKVTGQKGVITSVSFDLYGCIQAIVQPKGGDQRWYDIARLEITSKNRVMDMPNWDNQYIADGRKGPAEKPVK